MGLDGESSSEGTGLRKVTVQNVTAFVSSWLQGADGERRKLENLAFLQAQ